MRLSSLVVYDVASTVAVAAVGRVDAGLALSVALGLAFGRGVAMIARGHRR